MIKTFYYMKEFVFDFPDDDDDDLGGELIEAKNSRELNEIICFFH